VYSKKLHPISQQEDSKASTSPAQKQEDAAPEAANSTSAQILDDIPEAQLLKPQVMLTLAKDIFMNRSPDIPSPWPHWSMYASEMADEPALYRTALNDFHRLAVSITKRLVHTAMFQASSRLRAQRTRTNKGISPIVKVRDVDTAINVLGLERNGNERWKGVARRCNLRVSGGKLAATGRLRKEMSWREVERELTEPSTDTHATDSETTVEPEEFRSRAMRSGTPLPMQDLTISDSDDNIDESDGDGDDDNLKEEEGFAFQPREPSGRYTSVRPTSSHDTPQPQMCTLEEFDQQARRQEERALWDMLGHEPSVKDNSDDEVGDDASLEDEKITTEPSGWRASIDYRAVSPPRDCSSPTHHAHANTFLTPSPGKPSTVCLSSPRPHHPQRSHTASKMVPVATALQRLARDGHEPANHPSRSNCAPKAQKPTPPHVATT
jgi:RNA polymerase I-specific transcription initiation factor RRN5